MRASFFLALLLATACGKVREPPAADAGPEGAAACFECHSDIEAAWQNPSSHRLLLRCEDCHVLSAPYGSGHAAVKACADCHSEAAHPSGGQCLTCHTPHGSTNAFLIKTEIAAANGTTASIHVTKPEGASPDGLVRAGVDGQTAGTGLCEVCHVGTNHYDAAGTASPHETGWCARCHSHQSGFAPGAPEY